MTSWWGARRLVVLGATAEDCHAAAKCLVEHAKLAVGPAVAACGHPACDGPPCGVGVDALAAFASHVAAADVHGVRGGVPVEPIFEEPVWGRRSAGFALPPLLLASFFVCDPPSGARQVLFLDSFEEAEQVEAAGRVVVHVASVGPLASVFEHAL